MASVRLITEKYPVGTSVAAHPRAGRVDGAAPVSTAVTTATVAADGSLTFVGLADGTPFVAYALISSVHTYQNFSTDPAPRVQKGRESRFIETPSDLKRRLWLPGGALGETIARTDAATNLAALTSGTLRLVGNCVLPAGTIINRVAFFSGTTAGATLTNQWFAVVRQSDLAVLGKTADDTSTAWAANTLKELVLSSPVSVSDDTAVYLGVMVAATTVPTLLGVALGNTVLSTGGGLGPILAGDSTTSLTNPASRGATAAALTGSGNLPYAFVR
jgi:hypothetical protein